MPRKLKGIRRKGKGWEAYVRVRGKLHTQRFSRQTRDRRAALRASDAPTTAQLWVDALGATRPRDTITRDDIEAVLQQWLATYTEPTVYHRRSALMQLYRVLDGAGAANPVKDTTCPKSWIPADHSVPVRDARRRSSRDAGLVLPEERHPPLDREAGRHA
jgi:hypothetical protein